MNFLQTHSQVGPMRPAKFNSVDSCSAGSAYSIRRRNEKAKSALGLSSRPQTSPPDSINRWRNFPEGQPNLFSRQSVIGLAHDCSRDTCKRVIINVSGMRYETQLGTLNRLPHTLLGNPDKREKYWDEQRQEYFFDRHRPSFQAVLYYYQSGGRLKRPFEVPSDVFLGELVFYELGSAAIGAYKMKEGYIPEKRQPFRKDGWRKRIWDVFETPSSSILAKIVPVVSVLFILVSVSCFCTETLPEFINEDCLNTTIVEPVSATQGAEAIATNGTNITSNANSTVNQHTRETYKMIPVHTGPLFIIESSCVVWFTIEYALRFISCPSKCKFVKSFLNLIDLLSIVPYYITLFMTLSTGVCLGKSSSALAILRVIRVLRVIKLGKHSRGLQILGKTISTSLSELTMFVLFFALAVVIFSSAMYFAEYSVNPQRFSSIPETFWYTVVTITTVGYGEVYPIGLAGKIVGSFCVLSGVLAIALPVPIIVTNFNIFYLRETGRGISAL